MLTNFYDACKYCVLNGGAYLLYAIIVLVTSIVFAGDREPSTKNISFQRLPPIPGGELPFPPLRTRPKPSITTLIAMFVLPLVNFKFFRNIIGGAIRLIKIMFLMTDNPSLLRSFLRYVNVYYLIIVLPAAFMPPVSYPQRRPDFHLLFAVILLICINALGDLISVRLNLRIFKKFEQSFPKNGKQDDFWQSARDEARYYLAVARGGVYSLVILICVLAFSSVLYAVQIGQLDFDSSTSFVINAWDRMLRFPDLRLELYWFRDRPGPFGFQGVPGLFLYGLTTFIPIIILLCLALVWLFLMPFRIAVSLPSTTRPVVRVVAAECAVALLCLIASYVTRLSF